MSLFWESEWEPFRELRRLHQRMDRLFRLSLGFEPLPRRMGVYPLVNISEDADYIYVRAELPGVKPEDLNVQIRDKNLIIRGERKISDEERRARYHRREREWGFFRRAVTLPGPVDPYRVEATCKDGILTVKLAKPEEAKPRRIQITSA